MWTQVNLLLKNKCRARAVQLYTGMVYKGPAVKDMKKELISILKKENLKNISEAVGISA